MPSCLEEDWIDKILVEANLLQSPNDVRYIVGSIISAQDSFYVLQHELVELRKRCLVQINPQKSRELRLVFRTQHVALVLLHNAYPNVRNSPKHLFYSTNYLSAYRFQAD